MQRHELTDAQFKWLEQFLPANGRRGGQWRNHHQVLNGIFWHLRTGSQWRDLPERYGSWQTVCDRFNRWRKKEFWDTIRPGQSHETKSFEVTMDAVKIPQPQGRPRTRPDRLAGDMGYNAGWIRDWCKRRKIKDVIPRPENQQKPDQAFDKQTYRRRNIIERLVGWLKECRAVFTRYDKLAVNYLAMVKLAVIQRYLRILDSPDRP